MSDLHRFHQDLIGGSLLSIQIIGQDGGEGRRRLYVNEACLKLFGFATRDEFLGLPLGAYTAPHDLDRISKIRLTRLRNDAVPTEYEYDAVKKDGTVFPVQVFVQSILWNGKAALQCTYIDLTERKQAEWKTAELNRELEHRVELRTAEAKASEERARAQFDNSPVPIFLWQRSGDDFVQTDYNVAAHKRSGGHAKGTRGSKASDLFARWPEGLDCLNRCFDQKAVVKHSGERPRIVSGGTEWIETTFVFVPPDRVIVHSQDMTEQKQAEDALRKAKEDADRANAAKTRFLAAASHDLRQPLQALALFSALLEGQLTEDRDREIVTRMDASIGTMSDLLNTLLDISKLEAGAITPELTEVPVDGLFRSVVNSLSSSVKENDIEFRTVAGHGVVRTDPVLVERILLNLAANAVQHSGGSRVLMGCRRRGDCLRIEVWDNGKGIPEDEQNKIFEEFYQLDNPARDRRKGLGLGLSIVDRVGRLLGHPIEMSSRVGSGSMFSVELPVAECARPVAPDSTAGLKAATSGVLVAVIDDEPEVLDALRMMIEALGYDVVAAASEEDALTKLSGNGRSPRVIISDYRLRDGARGTDAIKAVQNASGEKIPCIILTGDTSPDELNEAGQNGIRVLHKPVRSRKLAAEIAEILNL